MSRGPSSDDAAELARRMQALRSTGDRDVRQLQHEMGRVSDWREYVRARPAACAVGAAVVGFAAVRMVFGKTPSGMQAPAAPMAMASAGRSPTSSALGFVGGIVGAMARQMITQYVKNEFKVGQHGSATQSNERQPGGERERTPSGF